MALFQVPGWSLPSVPVTVAGQVSRKRKRPSVNDIKKIYMGAEVNLTKLHKKLKSGNHNDRKTSKQKPEGGRKRKEKGANGLVRFDEAKTDKIGGSSKVTEYPMKPLDATSSSSMHAVAKKLKNSTTINDTKAINQPTSMPHAGTSALTTLQKGMKQSLDGARFRWINEVLYKSDSAQAHQMMQNDPKLYEEYHTGFRHQVNSWPTNPVSHYINTLSSYPVKTVIADLGCGDASLARALIPKGLTVLSFDLLSDGAFVIEADTHVKIPLPGSKVNHGEGEGHVVDVVVCALSLMGINWPNCIREAWRILKPGCELKITEVASRFTDVDEFVSLVKSIGFRLASKDDLNTHFTHFVFKKTARKGMNDEKWAIVLSKGSILKPCEYKRR